jgi:hypothetical protein
LLTVLKILSTVLMVVGAAKGGGRPSAILRNPFVVMYRYLSVRRDLDAIQPVPGSRERAWAPCTWLIGLGILVPLVLWPFIYVLPALEPWLLWGGAASVALGLGWLLVSALLETLRGE